MKQFRSQILIATLALAAPLVFLLGSTPAAAATTRIASCVDGGGVRWSAQAVWGDTYLEEGVRRISLADVGWTTKAGKVKTDSRVQTYDGAGLTVQTETWTGTYDYRSGRTYRSVNPRNPPTAGRPQVKVTLGVDGDGHSDCTMTFIQPNQVRPTPAVSASDRYEAAVLTGTNARRSTDGDPALTADSCVDRDAEAHATKLAAERTLVHQSLGPILQACGLNTVGENIAYGYPDGDVATQGWMDSPGHRANILNGKFRLLGVGTAQSDQGVWFAVQVFGTRP